jgi:hypothetical protein
MKLQQRVPDSASASSGEDLDQEFLRETQFVPDIVSDDVDQPAAAGAKPENEAIAPELIASALGPSFQAIFHFLATRRGDHWELQEFEKKALTQGWTPILQYLLAKLGSQEQVLLTLACLSTAAIVSGKAAQDIKLASSKASTRTRAFVASSPSSASADSARPPASSDSFQEDAA